MTSLTRERPRYSVQQLDDRVQADLREPPRRGNAALVDGWSADSWSACESAFLAVVVPSAAKRGDSNAVRWQVESELVECSRALPMEWPLSDWLSDYRDLLSTALADREAAAGSARWEDGIKSFLNLMLTGQDRAAAQFIRALIHSRPFPEEISKIRHVQALFASIRPARSLAEMLGVRIVMQSGPWR
jgi:hypothetical protein